MFSGRETELTWIDKVLENSPALHQRVCLHGLGSIGKSEIAFECARKRSNGRSTFWIKADTAENLESGYAAIAKRVIPNFQPKKGDVFAVVKEYLESPDSPPWFMVLDGADNTDVFFGNQEDNNRLKYVPQARHGQILITSRDDRLLSVAAGQLVSPANGLQVGPMSTQDGTVLFQKLIPHDQRGLHAQILAPQGVRFLDMLGGLPLAVVQATSYMIWEGITIQDFIDLYEKVEGHGRIFDKPAIDIDRRVISVLRTWEISYIKIAEDSKLGSKSHAAILLDLLGFIDSKSSPILRHISEPDFIYKDDKGSNPMDGFRETSEGQPNLETIFEARSSPRALLSRVFESRINSSTELDFKSATAKLQRYSLIDEDCWVPPVVHNWISHRLEPEERCKYIQWLAEELWQQILLRDVDFDSRWEDLLLPPNYHELVLHELPPLRHARVLLDHASSKTVLDSMTHGNYFAHETVELLYRLGRMLASAGKTKDGIYYLEKAMKGMESLIPPLPSTLISERRLQLAKTRFRTSDLADAVEEAKSLSDSTPSNRAALWLAQCLQMAGELRDASVIFQNIIAILPTQFPRDPDSTKVVFAASFGAVTTLSMMSDGSSKIEARKIIDKNLVPFLQELHDGNTLKVVLYPEILIRRLEVASNLEDQKKTVQTFMDYDATTYDVSLTGGKQLQWRSLLSELRNQGRWTAIQALGEAFVDERRSFKELFDLCYDEINPAHFNRLLAEINAWISIYYRLGIAYFELQKSDKAEGAHWAALGLCLGLFPGQIDTTLFEANLWRLHMILATQKKDRSCQIIWSFFGNFIEKEDARRKDIGHPSEV